MSDLSIRQLEEEIDLLNGVCSVQAAEIYELETKLNEIKEIYTGMDGFKPETAPEAYLLRIVEQMYKTAIGE